MNEQAIQQLKKVLLDHMTAYAEAIEQLRRNQMSIVRIHHFPTGEVSLGAEALLQANRDDWAALWGIDGWRNDAFIMQLIAKVEQRMQQIDDDVFIGRLKRRQYAEFPKHINSAYFIDGIDNTPPG